MRKGLSNMQVLKSYLLFLFVTDCLADDIPQRFFDNSTIFYRINYDLIVKFSIKFYPHSIDKYN